MKTKNLHRRAHNRALVKRKRAPFSMREGHPDNVLLNAPFTLKEMETQLDRCKDSALGPDDITISMIKHLTTLAKHICKLFERMVNHRLMWFLEMNNILCPEQSGFRKHRSTIDALTQLTCHIEKGLKEKKHTVAVFFDLEKAYDTVWRPEILNYMHEMGLRGNLPAFAEGFPSFREFYVRVGASHSEYFVQGSVLSVTLFAIAINEITKQLGSEVHCTLYVDDFTIFCLSSHHNPFNQDFSNCYQQPRTVDEN